MDSRITSKKLLIYSALTAHPISKTCQKHGKS